MDAAERAENDAWTVEAHLLALLAELASVQASGRQLKKPIDIDRPGKKKKGERGVRHPDDDRPAPGGEPSAEPRPLRAPTPPPSMRQDDPYKRGIAVLARTAKPR